MTYDEMKREIEKAKESKIKAETLLEQIKSNWKTEFDISSYEEALEKEEDFKQSLQRMESKRNALMQELEVLIKENTK